VSATLQSLSPILPGHWLSVREFALLYNRTPRRIQQMCKTGEIMEFSVSTYQDDHGRWWILQPSPHEAAKPSLT
jgi:hypothetical protein